MRLISVWALRPGMKVARRVYDAQGHLLLNLGVRLEMEYIQRLKKMGIRAVYIEDSLIPDVDIEDVILEETRQKAIGLVHRALHELKETQGCKFSRLYTVKSEMAAVLDDIVAQLLDNRNLTVNLSDIRSTDNYTFAHSVNVAVLSIITALSMNLPKGDLKKLGLGSILHDLGKILLPLSILNKNGPLLSEEMQEVRRHPSYGYNMLKNQRFLYGQSAATVLQHHERINGTGYPQGLKRDEIALFPKICAVADVYDALVSDRPYRRALAPYQALEVLEAKSEGFELQVLQTFYQHIAAYPIGTVVGLSDGYIGVVVHNTVGYPTRPRVRVLGHKEEFAPLQPFEVDLVKVLSLVVDRIYEEHEIPAHLYKNCRV